MEPVKRLFPETQGSFFILGPRGTGKSTLLRDHYPGAAKIDLLEAAEYRTYLAQPERLSDFVGTYKSRNTIIIDEIQRVPELLPMVHKLIESTPSVRFILTGSSSRKLRKTGVDLLGGRAGIRKMHPFIAAELEESFTLQQALETGMLPLVWSSENQAQTLRGYINLYLEQEVRAESMIRRLDNFARFLETLSFSHANLLSLSEIARECEVKRSTVDNYIEIVEELLIGIRVPIFSRRAKRSLVTHSKFYFFDCGVFRSLRPQARSTNRKNYPGKPSKGLCTSICRHGSIIPDPMDACISGERHREPRSTSSSTAAIVSGQSRSRIPQQYGAAICGL